MKRLRVILVMTLAALLIAGFAPDRWLQAKSWFGLGAGPRGYLGYVEGETTLIASPTAGRLVSRPVDRGALVARGTVLFTVDTAAAEAEVAHAEAALQQAKAEYENLTTGKREPEQDVVRAARREAEAALRLARQDLARSTALLEKNAVSRERFDHDRSQVDQLKATIERLTAEEAAGNLGGRTREREAALQRIEQAKADLAQARVRLRDLTGMAPDDALVEDTFFDPGEWVGAGQPVVSLLPDAAIKLRFFVPEADVALATPGTVVAFRCDGCSPGRTATITYVAPRAEYTPPVIYSQSAREKMVFLVEAKPVVADGALRPGLPVDVAPLRAPGS